MKGGEEEEEEKNEAWISTAERSKAPTEKKLRPFVLERERESITNPLTLGEEFANKYAAHGEKTIQHIISPFSTIRQTFSSSKPSSNFLSDRGGWALRGLDLSLCVFRRPFSSSLFAAVVRSNGDIKGQKTFFLFSPC